MLTGGGGADIFVYMFDNAGTDTITILIDDEGNTGFGGPKTATATLSAVVNPVNDAPELTTTTVTPAAFTEDGSAVVVDALLTLADVDSAVINSATVEIANYVPGEGVLTFTPTGAVAGSFDAALSTRFGLSLSTYEPECSRLSAPDQGQWN